MRVEMENPVAARYEIVEKLGEGGMGVVYKGRDARLGRSVALKFLSASTAQSTEACHRGLSEARAIAALNHPNIATIYEVGENEGAPVLVLEYLPGGTLRSCLDAGPIAPGDIVQYGIQIADGLAYAHSHGLVHGDVKPENLIFTEDGRLKLTDFGLARFYGEHTVTLHGVISGTPMYMSPECLQGWPADCRADIFSLGVMLEEMAGGRAMPEMFQGIVDRATTRDRGQRFPNMDEMGAALRRVRPMSVARETPTVLVIEDDEGLRSALEMSLCAEGYRVLKAHNGREGIRLAVEGAPEVVLLDVM